MDPSPPPDRPAAAPPPDPLARTAGRGWDSEQVLTLLQAHDRESVADSVARAARTAVGLSRCIVYLLDDEGRRYDAVAASPTDALGDAAALGLGARTHELTHEITQLRAPSALTDLPGAQQDPDASTAPWGASTIIAAAFRDERDVHGFILCETGRTDPDISRELGFIVTVATTALLRVRDDAARAAALSAEIRRSRLLSHTAALDKRLGTSLLAGAGIEALVAVGADLIGRSIVLYDVKGHRAVSAGGGAGDEVRLLEEGGPQSGRCWRESSPIPASPFPPLWPTASAVGTSWRQWTSAPSAGAGSRWRSDRRSSRFWTSEASGGSPPISRWSSRRNAERPWPRWTREQPWRDC